VGVVWGIQAGPIPPFLGQSGGHGRRDTVVVGPGLQTGPTPKRIGGVGHRGRVSASGAGDAKTVAMKAARTVTMVKLFIAVLKL
jgi:hypothetical protein